MAVCPFYRLDRTVIERRRQRRNAHAEPPPVSAPWCAHLYSPVSKFVAMRIVGGAYKLRCAGDLAKCQVSPSLRPKI
jgi:hypothetical protein